MMKVGKFGLVLCVAASAMALTGCFEDKPDDELAAKTVRPYAESDLVDGLEIANFKRSNGQAETDSINKYKITYSYDLRLAKPYAEVVLGNAKNIKKQNEENVKRETGKFFDATRLQNEVDAIQSDMTITQWVHDQGDAFGKRRDAFLKACSPCAAYWDSKDQPDDATARRMAFISSWIYFESLGFKDEAKIGDSLPRTAWATFTKTEKGWQPIQ